MLEKFENGIWEEESGQLVWMLIGYSLKPGGRFNQKIDVIRLESGSYRVSKHVDAYGGFIEKTLFAEFTVERPPEYVFPEPPSRPQYFAHTSLAILNYPGQPHLIIHNQDTRDLYVNRSYVIEVLEDDQWTRFHTYYSQEIEVIKWGESFSQKISAPDLPAGEYRVLFQIGMEGSTEVETGKCRFRVKMVKRPH
jgi:hypothetical protein